jgi:hypothetical protein
MGIGGILPGLKRDRGVMPRSIMSMSYISSPPSRLHAVAVQLYCFYFYILCLSDTHTWTVATYPFYLTPLDFITSFIFGEEYKLRTLRSHYGILFSLLLRPLFQVQIFKLQLFQLTGKSTDSGRTVG